MANCIQHLTWIPSTVLLCMLIVSSEGVLNGRPCNRSRVVLRDNWGIVEDGPEGINYTQDSHCTWIILPNNPEQFVNLEFLSMNTECSYDYVFIHAGSSFQSPLLASFSGRTIPPPLWSKESMLILLYSDTNYVLDGFRAEYSVTDCPQNCSSRGQCVNYKCECNMGYVGEACQHETCVDDCGMSAGRGVCDKNAKCICNEGYSGDSCSLSRKESLGTFHWLSRVGLGPRAAAAGAYVARKDQFYVFGGYNLTNTLGDLRAYDFSISTWLNLMTNGPSPRHGHAVASRYDGFYLYGGKLAGGEASDELWFFDAVDETWTLQNVNGSFKPPGLCRHSLTLVDDNLYVFGGSLSHGAFSSKLYHYSIKNALWEEVVPRGGKQLDVRVASHTTVYNREAHALLVYGGIVADVARFSRLSDRMFAFDLHRHHWAELSYPRAQLNVPRERAFHSANVIGNYMVVFGGYSHRHNREEICYDNQVYLFHLGCHSWVSTLALNNQKQPAHQWSIAAPGYPKQQGVFAHATSVRAGNTLLISGGYHGTVSEDFLAFVIPPELASSDGETPYDPEIACGRYRSQLQCTSNPECGWCPADGGICYERTSGSNCTSNLQTTQCPGICPSLSDCHSCLVHGNKFRENRGRNSVNAPVPSVANKLGLGQCGWCVQNARCRRREDHAGTCGSGIETPSGIGGWWGSRGTEIAHVEECRELDLRPGLTYLQYHYPANWSQPDAVNIINISSTTYFHGGYISSQREMASGAYVIVRLLGFLRPPSTWEGTNESLEMCASHSDATLRLSVDGTLAGLVMVANHSGETEECVQAKLPSSAGPPSTLHLHPGRYLIDLQLRKQLGPTSSGQRYGLQKVSKLQLFHVANRDQRQSFSFEYLEPFSNGSCSLYTNCFMCVADALCGWCDVDSRCISRREKLAEDSCSRDANSSYLILQPNLCTNCSSYIDCEECADSGICEWWLEEAQCNRKGRFPDAVTNKGKCPPRCSQRDSCASCLGQPGRCVWCEEKKECFLFSTYTSEYQFGSCREWVDQDRYSPAAIASSSLSLPWSHCKSCEQHANCSSCLESLGCGWCYSASNPTVGICTAGDLSSPLQGNCTAALERHHSHVLTEDKAITNVSWAYTTCPDIDECALEIHDCHPNATCSNTYGSYICKCNRGFNGDGKSACNKTCYETCLNGYCSGPPNYVCMCHLGWTGANCAIDCGCHNHSTCRTGVGVCDQCEDWTTGRQCQYCRPGSYGNATMAQGCHVCNCNDHGDDTRGVCDPLTGECFCRDNTRGRKCNQCAEGHYGEPRDGGMCYSECSSRGVITSASTGHLGSRRSDEELHVNSSLAHTQDCLWIITVADLLKSPTSDSVPIRLTLHSDLDIRCGSNFVYVYDGLPRFISQPALESSLLGAYCSGSNHLIAEAKSGIMTVYFKRDSSRPNEGFNASYTISSCAVECEERQVCHKGRCVCANGWAGVSCDISICPGNCNVHLKRGFCDKNYGRCVCSEGWGGANCSSRIAEGLISFTDVFDPERLAEGLEHLRTTLPRFGHSLNADRRGSVWLFGGYSLARGPLNDIREFDTDNNTWLQVTVQVQPGELEMPPERYFHAAEYVSTQKELYVYGGIGSLSPTSDDTSVYLDDFWKFNVVSRKWTRIESTSNTSLALAGHTLTWRGDTTSQSLLLVGGFSPDYGFLEHTYEYDLSTGSWNVLNISGNVPVGIYGHSAAFHPATDCLYVYGGILYKVNRTILSGELYAFHYSTKRWTVLPPSKEHNSIEYNIPQPRFLHSAVALENYMVIVGGYSDESARNATDFIFAYKYSCNLWICLSCEDQSIIGNIPQSPIAALAVAANADVNSLYMMGGLESGAATGRVTRIDLPSDLCQLWSNSVEVCKSTVGCSYCTVKVVEGADNDTFCYDSSKRVPDSCESHASYDFSKGTVCNAEWLSQRDCYQYLSCTECLSEWLSYPSVKQTCKWCGNCQRGRCIPFHNKCKEENICNLKQVDTEDVSDCRELQCPSSDCDKCSEGGRCIWTRQVSRSSEVSRKLHPMPFFAWNCVKQNLREHSSFQLVSMPPDKCPARCNLHVSCKACLDSTGAEGGWHECRWSTALGECMSPSYQALRCMGGVCGAVLDGSSDKCPRSCDTFTQCAQCLKQPQCGWCSYDSNDMTGFGLCTSGSLEGPLVGTCSSMNYSQIVRDPKAADKTSWHYTKCPPENECLNGHHTCDAQSEKCVNQDIGFKCVCSDGYKTDGYTCQPVCSDGCVHGECIEPGKCQCHFGFVGKNCSIQCKCNGHSDCKGPDDLDVCLQCHNNTRKPQCEKCQHLFVGDPHNNGHCVSCFDYCNGHTNHCYSDEFIQKLIHSSNGTVDDDDFLDISDEDMAVARKYMERGLFSRFATSRGGTRCINCQNLTLGDKCDRCIPGNFRGSDDKRDPCRPCECHGHGNMCEPDSGERCNCQNNTETDPQCQHLQHPHHQLPGSDRSVGNAIPGTTIVNSNGQSSSNRNPGSQPCWQLQCSKCREQFLGQPTNGHQCYRQMTVDQDHCFDPKSQDDCNRVISAGVGRFHHHQKQLPRGSSVFLAVQPKFMNVNIRVVVDVSEGSVDLYLSPKDDTFVVTVNRTLGVHEISIDQKYGLTVPRRRKEEMDGSKLQSASLLRGDPGLLSSSLSTADSYHNVTPGSGQRLSSSHYKLDVREARGLHTFVTLSDPDAILIVRGLRDRLVISLPQDAHDLRSTRFYVVAHANPESDLLSTGYSSGNVFFRQDQLHIDLFVFFSVFFSCFFLFLAVCVVAWKAKQAVDVRRARRRHVVEMLHMAKRPFASVTVVICPEDEDNSMHSVAPASLVSPARRGRSKKLPAQIPAATDSPKLTSSSAQQVLQQQHHPLLPVSVRDRETAPIENRCHVHPIAVEPTDDGIAAVASVFVQLPGGNAAPVRLSLASCLVLLSRVYPTGGGSRGAFLRRRTSHLGT